MSKELVRKQFVISLRNGMIAYILADKIEDIAGALQNNKFFNTKEEMLINTADIVAIMSPTEWSEQQKYQRGWYKGMAGTVWYNKKGEQEESTSLGDNYRSAERRAKAIIESPSEEAALVFLNTLENAACRHLFETRQIALLKSIEDIAGKDLAKA